MSLKALKAEIAGTYGTPAVVIDLDVVESNIARVQAMCDAAGIANRPHIKTHKSPEIAKMQIAAGAKGITCQKLGEAEVMADAGIDDIFISYNLLGEQKTGRLGHLLARTQVRVAADNPVVVAGLSHAGEIAGRPLEVVVECDTGRKRAGVETGLSRYGACGPARCRHSNRHRLLGRHAQSEQSVQIARGHRTSGGHLHL